MEMKNWILAAAAALPLFFSSCGKEDDPAVIPASSGYKGVLEVVYQEELYLTKDISVTIDYDAAAGTADIYMYAVRFVPQMPVVIDFMIPSVPASVSGTTVSFSGEDIVPQMLGAGGALTPVPAYTVTGLQGVFDEESASFSLRFGSYPTAYNGVAAD